MVSLEHPLGVVGAGLDRRLLTVHHVTAKRRQLDAVDQFGGRRARLDELAGDAPQLDDRQHGAVGQHGGHLQDDLELLPDADGGEVVEGLRAVAGLEHERAPGGDLGQRLAQQAGLPGEDERRQRAQPCAGGIDSGRVQPLGLMERPALPPKAGCPGRFGDRHGLRQVYRSGPGRPAIERPTNHEADVTGVPCRRLRRPDRAAG